MSDPFEGRPFPRGVLIGAALLIAFVIAAAAMVRITGVGGIQMPIAPVKEARELVFEDIDSGRMLVGLPSEEGGRVDRDAVVAILESGVDGFAMGVMRGMKRGRDRREIPLTMPYQLALLEDGRLVFRDPELGTEIDLRAFGPTNAAAFARLLRVEPRSEAEVSAAEQAR